METRRFFLTILTLLILLPLILPAQEKTKTSLSIKSMQKQFSSRAFCPPEIKEFMHFYPDIEYSSFYDMEESDWKIEMTADLYFERTSKPKEKNQQSFIGLTVGSFPRKNCQTKKNTGFSATSTKTSSETQALTQKRKLRELPISALLKTDRMQAEPPCSSSTGFIRLSHAKSSKNT